ncbi:hypothetical protein BC834DRAFT_503416 [Gloeopeniophorella convolvens]|nr:hypothetical protein BC834DRAFT_503416 [Gloeopeniophorella convolvens]
MGHETPAASADDLLPRGRAPARARDRVGQRVSSSATCSTPAQRRVQNMRAAARARDDPPGPLERLAEDTREAKVAIPTGELHPAAIFGYARAIPATHAHPPTPVRSADDKEYCDLTHALPCSEGRAIHKVTAKSYSHARHITQPGLHLLTAPHPLCQRQIRSCRLGGDGAWVSTVLGLGTTVTRWLVY